LINDLHEAAQGKRILKIIHGIPADGRIYRRSINKLLAILVFNGSGYVIPVNPDRGKGAHIVKGKSRAHLGKGHQSLQQIHGQGGGGVKGIGAVQDTFCAHLAPGYDLPSEPGKEGTIRDVDKCQEEIDIPFQVIDLISIVKEIIPPCVIIREDIRPDVPDAVVKSPQL